MTHIVRPANPGDMQALYEMAKSTGGGFTNLPPDRNALAAKLERSAKAFTRAVADRWADAHVAAGADPEQAARGADATYGFYTGQTPEA